MTEVIRITQNFRDKARIFLGKKYTFITIAACSLVLSMLWGAMGYIFGILVVLLIAWANKWRFSIFRLKKTRLFRDVIYALLLSIAILILVDGLLQPLVEVFFGKVDLESFDAIKGNLSSFLILLAIMWVTAAFGEELFYRGYLMRGIAHQLGDKSESWFLAAFISGVYFGLAHLYQGPSGIITTGFIGFLMGLLFMQRKNLWLLVFVHGIYDTIGLTLLFLDRETWIADLLAF